MNFLKNILISIVWLSALSIDAKGGKANPAARQIIQPVAQPEQRPAPMIRKAVQQKPTTFKSLMLFVKNSKLAWDNTNKKLDSAFVDSMIQLVRDAQLEEIHLQTLLQTARDMHGVFSDNSKENIKILDSIHSQIADAMDEL